MAKCNENKRRRKRARSKMDQYYKTKNIDSTLFLMPDFHIADL